MTASTPKSRKAKGRQLQQAVREAIMKELEIPESDVLSTPMGIAGCDVLLSKGARERFPFGIECKSQEALNIWAAMKQAEVNAYGAGLKPLLVFRRNRSEIYVCLPWGVFLQMVKDLKEWGP